jgi:transposase
MILSTQGIEKDYEGQVCWQEKEHGKNISLTARHFGLTRYTARTWQKKLVQFGPKGLNDASHRPKNLRQPQLAGR